VRASCAGGGYGMGWTFETIFHRDMAGGEVDEEFRDEEGGDFFGTL